MEKISAGEMIIGFIYIFGTYCYQQVILSAIFQNEFFVPLLTLKIDKNGISGRVRGFTANEHFILLLL